jgi:hypothetical protein
MEIALLHLAKVVCLVMGSLLGFVAAYIWFKASAAKVTEDDPRYDVGVDMVGHDPKNKDQPLYVAQTVVKQSRFNKIAAILTALAVVFQALAGLLSLW